MKASKAVSWKSNISVMSRKPSGKENKSQHTSVSRLGAKLHLCAETTKHHLTEQPRAETTCRLCGLLQPIILAQGKEIPCLQAQHQKCPKATHSNHYREQRPKIWLLSQMEAMNNSRAESICVCTVSGWVSVYQHLIKAKSWQQEPSSGPTPERSLHRPSCAAGLQPEHLPSPLSSSPHTKIFPEAAAGSRKRNFHSKTNAHL